MYKISTGQVENTIKVGGGVLIDSYRVGDRLYLAREYAGGLGVIDMKEGKLLDLIETKDWLFQVRAGIDKAFVWGEFNGVGAIDLKTREYASLEQPGAATKRRALTLQAGPDGGLLVFSAAASQVHQYDAAGKIVGHMPIDKSAGKFVEALERRRHFYFGQRREPHYANDTSEGERLNSPLHMLQMLHIRTAARAAPGRYNR